MNIFALSSGRGPCGIAIIRMSGPDTLGICKLISKEKKIKKFVYGYLPVRNFVGLLALQHNRKLDSFSQKKSITNIKNFFAIIGRLVKYIIRLSKFFFKLDTLP